MDSFLMFTYAIGLAAFGVHFTGLAQTTYCVDSDPGQGKTQADCAETKTWNEYLAEQHYYFNNIFNITFLFYSGSHHMNSSLKANNTRSILLSGSSPDEVTLVASLPSISTSLIFNNFSNIIISGIKIDLCASAVTTKAVYNSLFFFSNGMNITVNNVILNNTCNGSEIYGEDTRDMTFSHLKLLHSNPSSCGSLCLPQNVSGTIKVVNSSFNTTPDDVQCYTPTVFINFGPSLLKNTTVLLYNTNFTCRNVLIINLESTSNIIMNNVIADGCVAKLGMGCISTQGVFSIHGTNGVLYIVNSTFRNCLSAIITDKMQVYIYDTNFTGNTALNGEPINKLYASALSIHGSGTLSNVKFSRNGFGVVSYVRPNPPTLLAYESSINIIDCTFTNNYGVALYCSYCYLSFHGYTTFYENEGYEGAAIYLIVNQETRLVYVHSIIMFRLNYAHYTAGAIQITGVDSNNPSCVFSNHQPDKEKESSDNGLIFIGNSAASAGDDIYGGYLDQALAYQDKNYTMPCIEVIRKSSNFTYKNNNSMSSISSKPSRVCLCNSTKSLTDSKPNCLQWNLTIRAFPGEDITLSVVAVGQTFGTSSGFVYAQLLLTTNSATINDTQKYQVVKQHNCNNVTYSIYSHPGHVILVLTTTSELIQHFGDSEEIQESIDQYNNNHHSYVPKLLLNIPIYINVSIKPCPPGFHLSGSVAGVRCVCAETIKNIDGVTCHISKKQLERSGTVWIGISNDNRSQVVLFSKYCPYNYCKPGRVNIFHSSDLQCEMNHTGRLCGKCPVGTSLTLGTSQCKQCSNTHLYLLLPFAVSGVVLVVFLKLSDLTTAGGLINGLILYANLVKAGFYTYFPPTTTNLYFFRVFIDWLNLDLGIETCFFDGLTSYWKTWLQFVFPLYVWAISLTMILMARYSFRMARLLGNNSVPVLATLFLLSYAKLFRVINLVMRYTMLEDINGTKTAVWSYDGHIDYFSPCHSILLTVAILVLIFLWLPYTCVLLFVKCLQRCGVQKINSFVARMQPFLDAHCGPFKDNHRYWFGVLLIARAIPLLIGTVSFTNSDRNTILSTIAVIAVIIVFQSRVYRKLYVSISESLFLVNLIFLAGSALYTLSVPDEYYHIQEVFTSVLVGFAVLQFIAITVFSTARHFRMICGYRQWIPLAVNDNTSDLDSHSYQ